MEEEERFPPLSSSFVLKDISNLKTPKRITKNPQFFTACNETPRSSSSFRYRSRPSLVPSSSRSKAKAKLKAFQLERSQSACKEQLKKDRSLKSLAKSLTAWLNFLFQNPEFCGCDLSINGCNESNVVRVDSAWRSPKRMRALWWRGEESENVVADVSSLKYSSLRSSLKDVCSFDELKQRMQVYLSLVSCKEAFNVMTQVAKNIDGGRLTMKANCPIVTDVGIKEKATKILMSYNPIWLRIGLYIIFGGDSLISPEGDLSSVKDISFLKMIIEKQFFSHTGLAKAYAYNKKLEGLYRPGFYENLGNIILKRTLLLVLILDRAKSQTSLPLNYGIDGVDGGSPLLFTVSSGIKSSRQVLNNFLSSDVMHEEGDLLAHLVTVGYKVSHQQSALVEFDFQVSNLFLDLQDGVRLCRVIQLLRHDSKIVVPSDTHKKNLANCGVALQYLREAGVMLCDEDGLKITRDDVADRDTELTLSLLWNIFVRLQLPLLIDRTTIASEISKIRGFNMDKLNVINSTNLGMLLNWIQAICENYGLKVDSFSSLVNRKAIWCLLDYYFRRELSCSNKDSHETRDEKSIMSTTDYTDAVHNFVLSQKLTAILGKFPEVMFSSAISDLLEHNGAVSEKSVVVLLTFILSQLIVKKNVDQLNFHKMLGCNCQTLERRRHSLTRRRSASTEAIVRTDRDLDITEDATKKFKIIQAWWRDMTERNYKSVVRPAASTSSCFPARKTSIDILREKAAIVIQSHFRRFIERHNSLKMTKAIGLIQTVTRAWLTVKKNSALNKFRFAGVPEVPSGHVARIWVAQRRDASCPILIKAAIVIQKCFRGWVVRSLHMIENASRKCQQKGLSNSEIEAATGIQIAWKNFVSRSLHKHTFAATKIQKQAIITIQSNFRQFKCSSTFQQYKTARIENASFKYEEKSLSIGETEAASRIQIAWKNFVCRYLQKQTYAATKIQSHYRAWQLRRSFIKQKQEIIKIQSNFRRLKSLQNQTFAATKIQSHFRGWQLRRSFVKQKQAIIAIQSKLRQLKCSNAFQQYKMAARSAIIIQSCVRRWIAQRRALRCRYLTVAIQRHCRGWLARKDLLKQRNAVIKIQRAIRCVICQKAFHLQKLAAIEIQRAIRGQISRKKLLGASSFCAASASSYGCNMSKGFFQSFELKLVITSVLKLQRWWRSVLLLKLRTKSAIIIQSHSRGWIAKQKAYIERHCIVLLQRHCRGWLVRKDFSLKRDSVIKIQRAIRCLICQKAFHLHKLAAIDIQRVIRGQLSRSRLLGASSFHVATAGSYNCKMSKGFFQSFELKLVITSVLKLQRWWRGVMLLKLRTKSAIIIQSHARGWIPKRETCRQKHCIVVIQRQSRGWLVRKDVLLRRDAVIKIQRAIRSLICQKAFHLQKLAAIDIQSVIRGQIARSRLLGATSVQAAGGGACNCNMAGGFFRSFELTLVIISVLKLQRWWRGVLLLKSRARSVIIIQTHARGWIARQKVYRKRTCIVVIQSYWKGYVARKESREQLLNLRLRMQKSAMNVDDSRRLINRLLSALSELLSMKSIRGILHNCETLDMATAHSLKCCEELVAAGAITILLKLIRAASRSIPDQQVLKHALSTLRNLARYPHLTQVLIDTPASVETILWELHRNKEEGYFIASQILKKICSNENGVITVHKFPALLKRLYNLVEELTRKAYNEKRNPRAVAVRDNTDRRLKEAVELLKLITNGYKSSKLPIAFAM
ncbi:hypothetical protein ES288_A10G015800v1 [Gossypium darwinii]|uniref:Calponin-homology (CH) domain-containing protein n=1 Tax=Gossypium darwinii TaxID=34276 RepID=A0A5D2ETY3_GOSDA|nr:hypothetical protein ES288_A10G015800v1 [Gossypium darwinii]